MKILYKYQSLPKNIDEHQYEIEQNQNENKYEHQYEMK